MHFVPTREIPRKRPSMQHDYASCCKSCGKGTVPEARAAVSGVDPRHVTYTTQRLLSWAEQNRETLALKEKKNTGWLFLATVLF